MHNWYDKTSEESIKTEVSDKCINPALPAVESKTKRKDMAVFHWNALCTHLYADDQQKQEQDKVTE